METTPAATLAGHPYTKVLAVYDAQGRRIARTIWQGGTAATPTFKSNHRYHYDGWNVISEYSSPNLQSPISPVCSYTWGLDLSNTPQGAGGVGGLLSLSLLSSVSESSVFYPSYDGNGNITAWSQKTSTAPTARREYDAFGNTLVSEGNWPSSYGFSTKPQDAETGLYYYGYRYYDPVTGRWPSRDPIEEEGGVNLCGFVGNNSINNWDYIGLKRKIMIGFFGAGQRAHHQNSWPSALKSRKGVKTFNARSWDDAKKWLLEHPQLDENNDGKVDSNDCKVDLRIVGFSWGGWSALRLSQWLKTTDEISSDDLRVVTKLGMLDPVDSWRTGNAQVSDNVKYSKEIYQTSGCINAKFSVNTLWGQSPQCNILI